jgi:hypothetical protein
MHTCNEHGIHQGTFSWLISSNNQSNHKLIPYFEKCIVALDRVHIPTHVPASCNPVAYCNRNGFLSQNVLGVCDFNLCFTYLHVGWEGSAHNARVLASARADDFKIPEDLFYLADAGYGLTGCASAISRRLSSPTRADFGSKKVSIHACLFSWSFHV